jgi:hypothetical protein
MNANLGDRIRVLESNVRPGFSGISGLVDAIAHGQIRPLQSFAQTVDAGHFSGVVAHAPAAIDGPLYLAGSPESDGSVGRHFDGKIDGQFPAGMGSGNYILDLETPEDALIFYGATFNPETLEFTSRFADVKKAADYPVARIDDMDRRKQHLREELSYLNANRLGLLKAGAYTPDGIVAEEARLNTELDALKTAEDISDVAMQETMQDVDRLSELLKRGADYYDSAFPREKDRIIRVIFSELSLDAETLHYKCAGGFAALQGRFVASSDPTGWFSELVYQHDDILSCIDMLNATLAADEPPTNIIKLPQRRKRGSDDDMTERLAA